MKADLHIHTNFTPGCSSTPEEVVDMALSKGLNYIAITDYNTTEGAERARKYAEGKGIVVLVGEEIECKEGHVLAINIKRELPKGITVYEAVRRIHKQGGIAIAPHPYSKNGIDFLAFTMEFDCVEGINGLDIFNINKIAVNQCKKYNMPMFSGSDARSIDDIGSCIIEFDGDILDCLVRGHFKTFGKKVSLVSVLTSKIKTLGIKLPKGGLNEKTKKSKRKSDEETFQI